MRSSYRLSSWLFLRLLGVIYLIAFASLWVQIEGLVGSGGILPVEEFLSAVSEQLGGERFWQVPTLCWLSSSDLFLNLLCATGVLLAILLVAGIVEVPALVGLWLGYLSLTTVGQDFLAFQWDVLLLETGLLAVFLFPPALRSGLATATPSILTLWLLRWLLFRLMFSSGVVKLLNGDETWRGLTALQFHYETQPLPSWVGWYVHQLPDWFQTVSVLIMFGIELVVPFFVFVRPAWRRLAFVALVALQLLIAWTGNYCFFNLLGIALCLLLLDDDVWPDRIRRLVWGKERRETTSRQWPRLVLIPFASLILLMSTVLMAGTVGLRVPWPEPVVTLYRWVAPLRSINHYGLFAMMTTERPEIIVEGSYDGEVWQAYEFKWKPGDPQRRPGFAAPHQPRLDWQMWFAALGAYQGNPWFVSFLSRLAEGSPEVLALLEETPFAERPPRYLRSLVYDYRFTDLAERRQTGAWWRREHRGSYLPIYSAERLQSRLP